MLFASISMYILVVSMSMGVASFFSMAVVLELLSWLFSSLLTTGVFNYLVVQSYFILLFFSALMSVSHVAAFFVLLKMGLIPFNAWLFKILVSLSLSSMMFLLTIHKLPPLLLLVSMISGSALNAILLLILFPLMMIPSVTSISLVLAVSSMAHTGWMLLAANSGILTLLGYWSVYVLCLLTLVAGVLKWAWLSSLNQTDLSKMNWLVLAGIPPFVMFWMKLIILVGLTSFWWEGLLGLLFITVLGTAAYYMLINISKINYQSQQMGGALLWSSVVILIVY